MIALDPMILWFAPRHDRGGEFIGPRRVVGERAAQRDKVDLAAGLLRTLVERAKACPPLGHHIEGEPGATPVPPNYCAETVTYLQFEYAD